MTVRELENRLGVGRDAAYALARRFGVKLGKSWKVPARVVRAILEGRFEEVGLKAPQKGV